MDFLRNEEKTYREFLAEPTQAHRSAIFMGLGFYGRPAQLTPVPPATAGEDTDTILL